MEEQRQLTKKERRGLRKEEKRREEEREARMQKFNRIRNYAIVVGILSLVGWGLYAFVQGSAPEDEDFSRAVPIMDDVSHIPVGGSQTVEYNSNPPTSGPHYSQTAQSGFREEEIADGHLIHNLEHGDVWISFHPRVSDNVREDLKQFASAKVIITPRSKNDTDVALVAWGRLDTFNIENDAVPVQRIRDFIIRHSNKGPERVPGASGGI